MRRLAAILLWTVFVVFLSGNTECQYNQYELDLKPTGHELERKLTCSRQGSDGEQHGSEGEQPHQVRVFDEAELKQISAQYSKRLTPKNAEIHIFKDKFMITMPEDIGGAGRYLRLTSLMGNASVYSERFRGDADQAAQLDQALKGVDRLVDYLIGWLSVELKDQPGLSLLSEFCDKQLRKDLHNLVVYMALAERLFYFDKKSSEEMGLRVVHYLVEQGYFTMTRVPKLAGAFYRSQIDKRAPELMAEVQRFLATKMGVADSKPVPKALNFLSDAEQAEKSLAEYLKTTPEYKKRWNKWSLEKKSNPEVTAPNPLSLVGDLILGEIVRLDFSTNDQLSIRLHLKTQPYLSNGKWVKASGRLEWTDLEIRSKTGLPTFAYAYWAEPDDKFQNKHFGKVVLKEEALAEYVVWRNGLNAREGVEWDDFLKKLKPQAAEKMLARLAEFRFSSEKDKPDAQADRPSLAETPIRLIGSGLSLESEPKK
jgi:hypothetical protein